MSAVIDPPSHCVDLAGTIDFDWHGKKFVLEILLFGVLQQAQKPAWMRVKSHASQQ
jgi:hypothetical protein